MWYSDLGSKLNITVLIFWLGLNIFVLLNSLVLLEWLTNTNQIYSPVICSPWHDTYLYRRRFMDHQRTRDKHVLEDRYQTFQSIFWERPCESVATLQTFLLSKPSLQKICFSLNIDNFALIPQFKLCALWPEVSGSLGSRHRRRRRLKMTYGLCISKIDGVSNGGSVIDWATLSSFYPLTNF